MIAYQFPGHKYRDCLYNVCKLPPVLILISTRLHHSSQSQAVLCSWLPHAGFSLVSSPPPARRRTNRRAAWQLVDIIVVWARRWETRRKEAGSMAGQVRIFPHSPYPMILSSTMILVLSLPLKFGKLTDWHIDIWNRDGQNNWRTISSNAHLRSDTTAYPTRHVNHIFSNAH